MAWNQDFKEVKEDKYSTMLKIVLKEKSFGISFIMYNVYSPYLDRKGFLKAFFSSGLLELENVKLDGDLNITLSKK